MRSAKQIKKEFSRPKWKIPFISDIIQNQRLLLEVMLNIRENIICKNNEKNHENKQERG